MSYVIFCKGKPGDKPYIIEDLKLRLFSIEELCYYIYSNVSLCDLELLKPELAAWIERQWGLPDLAESIRVVLQKDPRAERVAAQIFAYTDFLIKQEREAVCERIRKYSQLGIYERRKMRGDYYYLDGKFREAIKDYEEMLEQKAYDDEKMHHGLLYNMGCCYASMFYYEIAYGCFLQAAELEVSKGEDLIAAMFCKKMSLDEKEWEAYLSRHKEFASFAASMERQFAKIKEEWDKSPEAGELLKLQKGSQGRTKEYYESMTKRVEEWKSQI